MLDDDNSTGNTTDNNSTGAAEQALPGQGVADLVEAQPDPGTDPGNDPGEEKKPARKAATRKTAASKTSAAKATTAKKATAAKTTAAKSTATAKKATAKKATAKKATSRKSTAKKAAAAPADEALPLEDAAPTEAPQAPAAPVEKTTEKPVETGTTPPTLLFQTPDVPTEPARRTRRKPAATADAATGKGDAPQDVPAGDAAPAKDAGDAPEAESTQDKSGNDGSSTNKSDQNKSDQNKSGKDKSGKDKSGKDGPKGKSGKGKSGKGKKKPDQDQDQDQGEDQAGGARLDEDASTDKQHAPTQQEGPGDASDDQDGQRTDQQDRSDQDSDNEQGGPRRRRRRGGRRRRKGDGNGSDGDDNNSQDSSGDSGDSGDSGSSGDDADGDAEKGSSSGSKTDSGSEGGGTRRRRRRRRAGEDGGDAGDDPENTVTRVRKTRSAEDQITAVSGSTRLEAKKQRRREGREAGRRRAPIVSEAEFLARREAVDRAMVIRQRTDLTQIAVLEDKVLVEHYVARESQTSLIGNVYIGRVQNVLPSMEAAFVDIGKGRNAVIYAGEVNWSALGHKDGQPRKIESVLSSGQSILVQVTKDPIGHKGARLTSQVSLAGRFLVYVPDGTTSGISRKLPDTERSRLKSLLKEIVPNTAGVIVRTAAEGASEEELTQDVERLKARWEAIEAKSKSGGSPKLLYGEPDLTLKVVRDLFTEDFSKLVIEGDEAWETVQEYVHEVAPDLEERLERFEPGEKGGDSFATYRIDEQISKGLDRKVWLPSGGSLIIDRTEAMTVVDVNTGKFTGSGGNLEETVTKNNLEAAEEIVRQLRLRDIGGIIVFDFIDMVLENNRDLVLRRLVECLGRDRTRHQVAEVTSLGLVQMTRKRIGTGLLESFSEDCSHCQGRGVVVHDAPIEPKGQDDDRRGGRRRGRGKGEGQSNGNQNGGQNNKSTPPSPKDVAAMAKPENADRAPLDEADAPKQAPKQASDHSANDQSGNDQSGGDQSRNDQSGGGGRSRRRGGRNSAKEDAGRAEATGSPAAPVSPAHESAKTGPTAEGPTAEGPTAEGSTGGQPSPEDAPTAASRTRTRRVATRRTGVVTSTPVAPIQVTPEPVESAAPAPVAPAPKVVTTTRTRRGASRPAGSSPTGEAGPEETPEQTGQQAGELTGELTGELHVPIKKKGSGKH